MLFPKYKLLFNNTHTNTRNIIQHGIPNTSSCGALFMLIDNKYALPKNITNLY
jgi:hypothetical protein